MPVHVVSFKDDEGEHGVFIHCKHLDQSELANDVLIADGVVIEFNGYIDKVTIESNVPYRDKQLNT